MGDEVGDPLGDLGDRQTFDVAGGRAVEEVWLPAVRDAWARVKVAGQRL
jgi:hypothetical protein